MYILLFNIVYFKFSFFLFSTESNIQYFFLFVCTFICLYVYICSSVSTHEDHSAATLASSTSEGLRIFCDWFEFTYQ